ncbi:MAG: hypothetical protein KZQ81_08245 [Candidatus Thiodiazotropha sp. (ex Rostrolucina anterorostrata)]|nr:hypothetical protein [Candidatus Thiodiazotropha sp. (ex Rostrolucina anterorostrata)]
MNGLRKAALYLHGMEEADRRWLLDALTEEEREGLHVTLAELDEMGVPRGNAWLPELAEVHTLDVREQEDVCQSSEIGAIEAADLSKLTQVFEHEPDSIVALLLKHRVWSWRQAYVGKQYLQKRELLLRTLETPGQPLKLKVEAALLTALATRLNKTETESGEDFEAALIEAQQGKQSTDQASRWRRFWRG